jgi:probable F420-dependent oxidoreductase
VTTRPFRFGLQAFAADTATEWKELARRVESLGFSTLFTCDHYFGPGSVSDDSAHRPVDLSPIVPLAVAAAVTTSLRVGCRVFSCDFHHPVVLAKECATLDLLSDGRMEIGLGAGWVKAEYDGMGIPMEPAGRRIDKLSDYITLMRAQFTGEDIAVDTPHVKVSGFAGRPVPVQQPHPPIMIGGGSRRILGLAGREADIVSINFNNAPGKLGPASFAAAGPEATMQKLAWIRDGAGDRFDRIEIETSAMSVAIDSNPEPARREMADRVGVSTQELDGNPHVLIGTVDEVCDRLRERRERYGISYVTVAHRNMDQFAPVVARLAGT